MAFARQTLPQPNASDYYQQVVLAMDENGDGSVTLDEFNAHVERVLRTIDTDGDGSLSDNELKAYRTQAIARPLKSAR
jgi:Ca2+-binding EF-hand superfamily protein